jgi:hypothetical protein
VITVLLRAAVVLLILGVIILAIRLGGLPH